MKSNCVYFLLRDGRIVYVGITSNIKARVGAHRNNGKRFDSYEVAVSGAGMTRSQLAEIESNLIEKHAPEYNRAWNPNYDAPCGYSVCTHQLATA